MRFEIKVILLSLLFSFFCMISFTYATELTQQKLYAYQVGIYKEESNKDDKIKELKDEGYEGYVYKKKDQYYVLSCITNEYKQIKEHSSQMKGIIKEYTVSSDMTIETLLEQLSQGDISD